MEPLTTLASIVDPPPFSTAVTLKSPVTRLLTVKSSSERSMIPITLEKSRFAAVVLGTEMIISPLLVLPTIDSATVGAAEAREAVVVDHAAGEVDQDRGEGCPPLQVCNIPDGWRGGSPRVVFNDP